MSRKDYQLIASVLSQCFNDCETIDEAVAIEYVSLKLSTALKQDNPLFNSKRFLAAARGVKG